MTPKQIKQIQNGTVADWIQEVRILTLKVYDHTTYDENLGYAYRYRFMDQIREQLHKGGLRLAALINETLK